MASPPTPPISVVPRVTATEKRSIRRIMRVLPNTTSGMLVVKPSTRTNTITALTATATARMLSRRLTGSATKMVRTAASGLRWCFASTSSPPCSLSNCSPMYHSKAPPTSCSCGISSRRRAKTVRPMRSTTAAIETNSSAFFCCACGSARTSALSPEGMVLIDKCLSRPTQNSGFCRNSVRFPARPVYKQKVPRQGVRALGWL